MKFGFLQEVCPEVEQFAEEQLADPYFYGAKYHQLMIGGMVNSDGTIAGQAYKLCYKGSIWSYFLFKTKLKGHATVLRGW